MLEKFAILFDYNNHRILVKGLEVDENPPRLFAKIVWNGWWGRQLRRTDNPRQFATIDKGKQIVVFEISENQGKWLKKLVFPTISEGDGKIFDFHCLRTKSKSGKSLILYLTSKGLIRLISFDSEFEAEGAQAVKQLDKEPVVCEHFLDLSADDKEQGMTLAVEGSGKRFVVQTKNSVDKAYKLYFFNLTEAPFEDIEGEDSHSDHLAMELKASFNFLQLNKEMAQAMCFIPSFEGRCLFLTVGSGMEYSYQVFNYDEEKEEIVYCPNMSDQVNGSGFCFSVRRCEENFVYSLDSKGELSRWVIKD